MIITNEYSNISLAKLVQADLKINRIFALYGGI